jgi:hypothetical protein
LKIAGYEVDDKLAYLLIGVALTVAGVVCLKIDPLQAAPIIGAGLYLIYKADQNGKKLDEVKNTVKSLVLCTMPADMAPCQYQKPAEGCLVESNKSA